MADRRGGALGTEHADVSPKGQVRSTDCNNDPGRPGSARPGSATREAEHDAHAAMLDRLARMLWQAQHAPSPHNHTYPEQP